MLVTSIIKQSYIEKKYDNTPVVNVPVQQQELPYTQLVVEPPKPNFVDNTISEVTDFEDTVEEEIEEKLPNNSNESMPKSMPKSTPKTEPTIEKKPQSTKPLQLQRIVLFKESKLFRLIK